MEIPVPGPRPATVLVSAGDLSGDLHGAALVAELRQRRPDLRIVAFGGSALAEAGAELLYPLADNPIMGFRRVLAALGHFVRLLSEADRMLQRLRPDAVVLIDFPGFNVNLARLARRLGLFTCYYVCPQYWGWAPWRVRRFARSVDQALVILPFEEEFWRRHGVPARYVGHPVADRVAVPAGRPAVPRECVGILPGSREHEVRAHLPWMLHAARELEARLGTLPRLCCTHPRAAVRALIAAQAGDAGVPLEVGDEPLPDLLTRCRAALVSSGTATLETALLGVPAVVLYRVSRLSRLAARLLLLSPYIAQPNLLAGHEVFPEFLAARDPAAEMSRALAELYRDGARRLRCETELRELRRRFLQPGAAARAADSILSRWGPAHGATDP